MKKPQLATVFGKRVLNSSRKHAEKVYPNESVGVVVDGKYIALTNVHTDPLNFFEVDPVELHKKTGGAKIEAIIHSHPIDKGGLVGPSEADMRTQLDWKIPFGIQIVNANGAGNIIWWGDDVPILPYVGRPYITGVSDCYSIVRDYYKQEFGIVISNYARDSDWWMGSNPKDLYVDHVKSEGFSEVPEGEPLKVGDVVFITAASKVVNHSVIYIGGDQCLHHMSGKISSQESINRFIDRNKTFFHSIWRHKDNA